MKYVAPTHAQKKGQARRSKKLAKVREEVEKREKESKLKHVLVQASARGIERKIEEFNSSGLFGHLFNRITGNGNFHRGRPLLHVKDEFKYFLIKIEERAPKLVSDPIVIDRLYAMSQAPQIRSVESWVPSGKGVPSVLSSLAAHLFAKFKMPSFLWSVFAYDTTGFERTHLTNVVVKVARGESLFELVKKMELCIPLTRKMCHEFMNSTEHKVYTALRKAQVVVKGGNRTLLETWLNSVGGRNLHEFRTVEEFWETVLDWFVKNPMLDAKAHLGPLCDFIAARSREDTSFSMKGRGVLPMLEAMRVWHGELSKAKKFSGEGYKRSGFKEFENDASTRDASGNIVSREIWRVQEIVSDRELHNEGKAMKHCVYSYSSSIKKGHISIWSVTKEDGRGETGNWKMSTVEVNNQMKRVVQVRGMMNRFPTAKEKDIVRRWAMINNLEVASSYA